MQLTRRNGAEVLRLQLGCEAASEESRAMSSSSNLILLSSEYINLPKQRDLNLWLQRLVFPSKVAVDTLTNGRQLILYEGHAII